MSNDKDIEWGIELAPVNRPEDIKWDKPVASEDTDGFVWDAIKGVVETPITLASGMAGFVGGAAKTLGDIAGQAVYSDEPVDVGSARKEGQGFAEKVTYAPRSKAGQKITRAITFPFEAAIEYGGPGAQESFNQLHKLVSRTGEFKDDYVAGLNKIGEAIKADLQGDYTKHAELVEELDLSDSEQHELGKLMVELGLIAAPFLKKGGRAVSRAIEKDIMALGEEGMRKAPKITEGVREIKQAVKEIKYDEAPTEIKAPVEAIKESPVETYYHGTTTGDFNLSEAIIKPREGTGVFGTGEYKLGPGLYITKNVKKANQYAIGEGANIKQIKIPKDRLKALDLSKDIDSISSDAFESAFREYARQSYPNKKISESIYQELKRDILADFERPDGTKTIKTNSDMYFALQNAFDAPELNNILSKKFNAIKAGDEVNIINPKKVFAEGQPEAPKYAGSINLENIGVTEDARSVLIQTAEEYKGQINEARRGIITEIETSKLADEMGLTVDELLSRQVGEAWNAEKALASRRMLASSSERIAQLQKAARETNSDANLVSLKEALLQHNEIQAAVSGVATEAGRALRQFRIEAGPEKGYKAALDALGGREINEAILDRLAKVDFSDPAQVNTFIREVSKATTADMVFEFWVNGLLSGPATHMVNIASNTLTWLLKLPEAATAAGIEAVRAGVKRSPRERFFGEVPYQVYGSWEGIKQGTRKGIWSFVNELSTEGASKIETRRYASIPSKKVNILGKEVTLGGKQIRLPGRMLMAMDEFFKALNYESAKHVLVYRKANQRGLKGQAKKNFIARSVNKPPFRIAKAAREDALYRVFQKELGPIGKSVQQFRESHPAIKMIIPFLRTPMNIVKYGLERTPLNYGRILTLMGKKALKGGALSEELARATVGSMIAMTSFMFAKEGQVTGAGPENRAKRDLLYRQGWQPYSIKVGDTYHHYGRMEPAGMVVGMAADAAEIWEELNEDEKADLATLLLRATAMNLSNKTFLKGVSDMLGAMFDPDRYLESYTQRFAASGVPSILASIERGVDPELRDAQTVVDTLKSRVPGLSSDLPARIDLWGDHIKAEGNVVARIISAAYTSKVKGNAIDKEMARLKIYPSMPSRKIGNIELTPEQYYDYARMAGQDSKKRLLKEVNSPSWKRRSDEAKIKTIKTVIRVSRLKAKTELMKKIK